MGRKSPPRGRTAENWVLTWLPMGGNLVYMNAQPVLYTYHDGYGRPDFDRPFFMVECNTCNIVLNSGHHYSNKSLADQLADEHNTEVHRSTTLTLPDGTKLDAREVSEAAVGDYVRFGRSEMWRVRDVNIVEADKDCYLEPIVAPSHVSACWISENALSPSEGYRIYRTTVRVGTS